MGVATSNGERAILYKGDLPGRQVEHRQRTTDDHIRYGRNALLGVGAVGVVGNGITAIVEALQHVPDSDSLGVATREAAIMAVAGVAFKAARQLVKRR